jgi:UDP-N-acetylenolpyruvoylglucosamine reductase
MKKDNPKSPNSDIAAKLKLIELELGSVRVKYNEPLKYHLASPTDATAKCFYVATTIKELTKVLELTKELKVPFFFYGAGTKVLITEDIEGLTIQNRTSGIRISGVKGKVSVNGIGVAEAMVEIESGVSLGKANDFLKDQNLRQFNFPYIPNSTIGGALYVTPPLQDLVQKVKVFQDGEISDIDTLDLKRNDYVLSVILKVKAAD